MQAEIHKQEGGLFVLQEYVKSILSIKQKANSAGKLNGKSARKQIPKVSDTKSQLRLQHLLCVWLLNKAQSQEKNMADD
jgi:hypothetical protein